MINRLFIPGNKEQIKAISNNGFNSFILPVYNISVGFDCYFTLEEINELSSKYEIYLMVNKFFHKEIDEVINKLVNLKNIKGIFVEDLGLLISLKNKGINVIMYQNHLNMNYDAINAYKNLGIENVVISNELTINEIKDIRNKCSSKLYYFIFSKNALMYTRRNLISNYNKHFNKKDKSKKIKVKESVTRHPLIIKEEDYGTVIINDKIFAGNSKIKEIKDSVDYLIYNLNFIDEEIVSILFENIDSESLSNLIDIDDYFLNNLIYYKVKDVRK